MTLTIGSILGGQYHIVSHIGTGSFGEIYLAEDLRARRRKCAIKRLIFPGNNPESFQKAKELFEREAQTLCLLNTPKSNQNIPQFFAYFDEQREFYLVSEWIDGYNLSEEIQQKSQLSEDEVVEILEEVLEILHFLHHQNIIHRDIKPDNIMRRYQDGHLVLIDFGAVKEVIAQSTQNPSQTKATLIYTPGYAPPEQQQGKPQFNSDLYALGMTALELLTGLEPERLQDYINNKISNSNIPTISDKLTQILAKMVSEDYKERYQSATEVLAAIRQLKQTGIFVPRQTNLVIKPQPISFIKPISRLLKLEILVPIGVAMIAATSYYAVKSIVYIESNTYAPPIRKPESSPPRVSNPDSPITNSLEVIETKPPLDNTLPASSIRFKRANPQPTATSTPQRSQQRSQPTPTQQKSDTSKTILFKRAN